MKKLIVIIIIFFSGFNAAAIGGEYVLQIQYLLNGKQTSGFIYVDYWDIEVDLEQTKLTDKAFDSLFRKLFIDYEEVTVYSELIDHELLSETASFPMHPFEINNNSAQKIKVAKIKNVRFVRIWKRIAYGIDVLTKLQLKDTSWISGKSNTTYPVGQDVGCRLEVYNFGNQEIPEKLIKQLILEYSNMDGMDANQKQKNRTVLADLKKRKIVVVEMCGC